MRLTKGRCSGARSSSVSAAHSRPGAHHCLNVFRHRGGFTLFGSSSAALASLGYEKTCVLFNVAALASQIASEQNLDNDEGLKVAAKYYQVRPWFSFLTHPEGGEGGSGVDPEHQGLNICVPVQLASGAFGHIKDTVLSALNREPTMDISPETMGALSTIMLAQAQEVIFLKAASGAISTGSLSTSVLGQTSTFTFIQNSAP